MTTQRYALPDVDEVTRTMDATHLNAIANDAAVRPFLGSDGPLDLAVPLSNPLNIGVVTPHGGFIGLSLGDGAYDMHSLFLPAGRGREAMRAMRAMREYMFSATDCVWMTTLVPVTHDGARWLARQAGFVPVERLTVPWGAGTVDADIFLLTMDRWARQTTTLARYGEWFHEVTHHALQERGSSLPPHSEQDAAHQQYAGAAVLMVRAGNVRKAEWFYNAWAATAGYPPIRVLRDQPPLIDLGGMVAEVRANHMEILSCQ